MKNRKLDGLRRLKIGGRGTGERIQAVLVADAVNEKQTFWLFSQRRTINGLLFMWKLNRRTISSVLIKQETILVAQTAGRAGKKHRKRYCLMTTLGLFLFAISG